MLVYKGSREEQEERVPETVFLHHYPDLSKSRSNYLDLLKLRAKENPNEFYGLFYLGNEYTYANDYENAIKVYLKILENPEVINDELSMSAINGMLATSYKMLKDYDLAIKYAKDAIISNPELRDPYGILGGIYLELKQYENAIYWINAGLTSSKRFLIGLSKHIIGKIECMICLG